MVFTGKMKGERVKEIKRVYMVVIINTGHETSTKLGGKRAKDSEKNYGITELQLWGVSRLLELGYRNGELEVVARLEI